ncbi:MAG: hypothetical protein ABI145_15615, partial [Steroidobacteraceae bacterium]
MSRQIHYSNSTGIALHNLISGAALSVILWVSAVFGTNTYARSPSASSTPIDEILVTGERPGPGLWRVSKGDHDLWILATLTPLPKGMTWRSKAVEARIARSQIVLAPPEIAADTGIFHDRHFSILLSEHRSRDGCAAGNLVAVEREGCCRRGHRYRRHRTRHL